MNAVEFQGVSKSYAIYDQPGDRLKELLSLNRLKRHKDFWALHDVSFEVKRGETFCIVGENGSGKSTLLQIVAGILHPTSGTATINGRVSALLELGAGFNPEFTGRDNVYLNGSILGLSTRQIDERYADIAAFAEIGDFINQPVKTYSSGMVVRLAFAVAINVDPEVLLVDEALAVGDIYFRQRCMRKVHELRSRGVTILFVSHAVSDVKAIGDRVLWLDHGRVVDVGEPERVISKYLAAMTEKDSAYLQLKADAQEKRLRAAPVLAPEIVETIPNIDHRYGDGRAEVIGIAVLDEQGEPLHLLEPATRIVVRISVRAKDDVALPMVGFMLRNQLGHRLLRHQHRARRLRAAADAGGRHLHGRFPPGPAGAVPGVVLVFAGDRGRHADGVQDVRLDRQCDGAADEPVERRDLRLPAAAVPRRSERAAWAPAPVLEKQHWLNSRASASSPAQVDVDLLNEHLARYTFAARLARGKRVLDAGCGAGYGVGRTGARGAVGGGNRLRGGGGGVRARALPAAQSAVRTGVLHGAAASRFELRPGGGVRGDRAPGELARLSARSAAGAGAQRAVHRLHAEQAVLHGIARRRRARIRFTCTNSNSKNSARS